MKMDNAVVQTKYTIRRVPEHGPHPLWCVYEKTDDTYELICGCTYLKGAENLVEHLCETDRRIQILRALRRVNFTVTA